MQGNAQTRKHALSRKTQMRADLFPHKKPNQTGSNVALIESVLFKINSTAGACYLRLIAR